MTMAFACKTSAIAMMATRGLVPLVLAILGVAMHMDVVCLLD